MTDVLIIGGGVIGMLCAREFSRAGASITLVERTSTGREASWAAGGILSPLYPWRAPEAITALAQLGQQRYPALANELLSESGIDPEWLCSGLLTLDTEDEFLAKVWAERNNVELERLTGDRLRKLVPALNSSFAHGLWLPQIAQIRSPRLLEALKRSLLLSGVSIREHTEATALVTRSADDGSGQLQILAVDTAKERLYSDKVILAGGAWNTQLLAATGLHLPVRPVRGQMILFSAKSDTLSHIILADDRYLVPRQDGRILVGSTLEEVGFNKGTTEGAMHELHQTALKLLPALVDCPVEQHWAGLRPGSPLGIPWIGAHPDIRGLFINTGHFRNGIVLAPGSARLLADIVLHRPPEIDPLPYQVQPTFYARESALP